MFREKSYHTVLQEKSRLGHHLVNMGIAMTKFGHHKPKLSIAIDESNIPILIPPTK